MNHQKTVLCYGDSLTWGWVPTSDGRDIERYPRELRWAGALQAELGSDFHVIEEGLSGRTTNLDDPIDGRLNGAAHLPTALATHSPVELVAIMLGTNDAKAYFRRSALDIAAGMARLGEIILTSSPTRVAPKVLLIAPPQIGRNRSPWFQDIFAGATEKIRRLPDLYERLAAYSNFGFFDAGRVIETDGIDGVHLSPDSNVALGAALVPSIRNLVG